jgi:hypothetical protein
LIERPGVSLVTAVVDFGSTHTVTVVHAAGRAPRVVTVDGDAWLPSSVFLSRDDQLVVGHDAVRMAATDPAHLETRVKARIAEREVLLGDTVLPVTALVKAVLARAVRAAGALAGEPVGHLVLTHPIGWDRARLGVLVAAARGVAPRVSTIAEPVGAGAWFATRGVVGVDGADRLPLGGVLAVLDIGGGTSDVAVVRRESSGIAVIGHDTIGDLGGDDLDQRIVDHLCAAVSGLRERLVDAAEPERVDLARLRELVAFRREVRRGKELLSRHERVELTLPDGLPAVTLTRARLAAVLGPDLDRLTAFTLRTIVRAGVEPAELTAVQLAGGSVRIPLLRRLLAEVIPAHLQLDDQPEAVIALGACAVAVSHSTPASESAFATEAPPATPVAAPVAAEPSRPSARHGRPLLALVAAVVVGVALLAFLSPPESIRGGAGATTERFTLDAAARGGALASDGAVTDGLVTGSLGTPVRMFDGDTDVDWTVAGVLDPATAPLVAAGAPTPPPDARWVLVDASIRARAPVSVPYYLAATYLLDDRGLLIPPVRDFAMPATCPTVAPPSLATGARARQCLAFLVSKRTPVTAVVISEVAGGRQAGVVVPVTGGAVAPGVAPPPEDAVPLGVVRPLRVGDTTVTAAIVDVVTAPGAYVDAAVVARPGSRAVLVRAVVTTKREVSVSDLSARLLLRDDRGQPVRARAASDRHGCASGKASGRVVVCAVFVVPAGLPLGSVAWSGDDFSWRPR